METSSRKDSKQSRKKTEFSLPLAVSFLPGFTYILFFVCDLKKKFFNTLSCGFYDDTEIISSLLQLIFRLYFSLIFLLPACRLNFKLYHWCFIPNPHNINIHLFVLPQNSRNYGRNLHCHNVE